MCGCLPGYVRQIDDQSNEICTGIFLSNNLITITIMWKINTIQDKDKDKDRHTLYY